MHNFSQAFGRYIASLAIFYLPLNHALVFKVIMNHKVASNDRLYCPKGIIQIEPSKCNHPNGTINVGKNPVKQNRPN